MSSPFQRQLGLLVTATVSRVLLDGPPDRRNFPPALIVASATDAVAVIPNGANRRRAIQVVASRAALYLGHCLPPPPWRLLGAEVPTGRRRVDLLFGTGSDTTEGELMADEVKSWSSNVVLDPAIARQLRGYLDGFRAEYGARFIGVRLVPVLYPRSIRLIASEFDLTSMENS